MSTTSQTFESFVPVYDTVPEKWEDAREFLVEHLKKVSNAVNLREIGWFLDEELLSGKAFIPGVNAGGNNAEQYRQVLRKTINTGALVAGANVVAHGVTVDANFSLVQLWVSGTNSGTLTSLTISGNSVVIVGPNLNITSPQVFDRSYAVIEYLQEL